MTTKPTILLAVDYTTKVNPSGRLLSEKLDGCRVVWTGRKLVTRGGNMVDAPAWFTVGLPTDALDGELWLGRGRFDQCQGIVRTKATSPLYSETLWRQMRFCVFDAQDHAGPFTERIKHYTAAVKGCRYAKAIKHRKCSGRRQMYAVYNKILADDGEGVMMRDPESLYIHERSDTLLRLKPAQEHTATGKIRYKNTGDRQPVACDNQFPIHEIISSGNGIKVAFTVYRKKGPRYEATHTLTQTHQVRPRNPLLCYPVPLHESPGGLATKQSAHTRRHGERHNPRGARQVIVVAA